MSDLPEASYQEAVRWIAKELTTQTMLDTNREKCKLLKDSVLISFRKV